MDSPGSGIFRLPFMILFLYGFITITLTILLYIIWQHPYFVLFSLASVLTWFFESIIRLPPWILLNYCILMELIARYAQHHLHWLLILEARFEEGLLWMLHQPYRWWLAILLFSFFDTFLHCILLMLWVLAAFVAHFSSRARQLLTWLLAVWVSLGEFY